MVLALGVPDLGGEQTNNQAEIHAAMQVAEGEGWGKGEDGLESLGDENRADTLGRQTQLCLVGVMARGDVGEDGSKIMLERCLRSMQLAGVGKSCLAKA